MTENRAKPSYAETYGAQYVGVSEGEGHFSLSYASGNMLAIAGLPFAPSRINIAYVKHLPLSGTMQTYTLDDTFINIGNGDTLELDDAQFRDGDFFEMGLKGFAPAHNPTSDAVRTESLDAIELAHPSYGEITGSYIYSISGGWISGSSMYDCDGYTMARIFCKIGYGKAGGAESNDFYFKPIGTFDPNDEEKYDGTHIHEPEQSNFPQATANVIHALSASIMGIQPFDDDGNIAIPTSHTTYPFFFDLNVSSLSKFNLEWSGSIGTDQTTGTIEGLRYKLLNGGEAGMVTG